MIFWHYAFNLRDSNKNPVADALIHLESTCFCD